jgi:uncharacterized protein YaiE (UPF0345 family)
MNRLRFATAMLLSTVAVSSALANDYYTITVRTAAAQKGQRAVATVSVAPKGDYHINTAYPVKLTITAPAGVTLEKAKQTNSDAKSFDSHNLDFDVAFVSNASGTKSFSGELDFAVIDDSNERPTRETVAFNVAVK